MDVSPRAQAKYLHLWDLLSPGGVTRQVREWPREGGPVGIYEVALPASKPVFIDWDSKLLGYNVDVRHVEVDQRIRLGISLVPREVEPDFSTCNRHEEWKARLELMLPLLREPKPSISADGMGDKPE
jgi:hypothetical protein